MFSDMGEKRVASSIFITLASPRRDCGPVKGPPFLPMERGAPPQPSPGPDEQPRGASGVASGGSPPPRVVPPRVEEASPGALQSTALPVETLGPNLQKEAAASPSSLQMSSAFLKEARQPQRASPLGWTDGQAEKKVENTAASGICAFCHEGISPGTLALELMNKRYHAKCFTCRTCHGTLAGQHCYEKGDQPLCVACYQKTLEKCDACQAVIVSEIVWALGRGYHPECFTCVACGREIGSEAFAVDDDQRVHCLPDFYRKFASVCGACEKLIIPHGGRDAYKIECLGRSFHEDCYRCEKCQVLLSLEPTQDGCYPLGCHLLCQACHVRQIECRPAE